MSAFTLKIPPVVTFLLVGGLMWVTARTVPGLEFALPARLGGAVILAGAGVTIALLGVGSFRRARTTVNPSTPKPPRPWWLQASIG